MTKVKEILVVDLEDLEEFADEVREELWDRDSQERARRIRASREAKAEDNGW